MFFEALEVSILNQLTTHINDALIKCEVEPETENDFTRVFKNGCLSVCYVDSDFDKAETAHKVGQFETEKFEIIIRSFRLRNTYGIYDLADKTRLALQGFRPQGCEPMQAIKLQKHSYDNENGFVYVFTFNTKTLTVQDYTPPVLVPVNTITFNQLT